MGELRTALATAGAALTALGIGLVILAEPALSDRNDRLAILGWVFASAGLGLLVIALGWTIYSVIKRPKLVIQGGSTQAFREIRRYAEPRHFVDCAHGASQIYLTRLRVKEMRGIQAKDTHMRITWSEPPIPDREMVGIPFVDGKSYWTIPPKGEVYVRLCELIKCGTGEHTNSASALASLTPGGRVDFTIEAVIDGVARFSQSFVADWSDQGADFPEVSAA